MDFSGISLLGAINQILSFAMIIIGGYAAIWGACKVINLIRYDTGLNDNDRIYVGMFQDDDGRLYQSYRDRSGIEHRDYDNDTSAPFNDDYDYDSLIAEQEQRIFEKESQNIYKDSSFPEYDYDSLIAEQEQRIFEKESQNIDKDSSFPEYDYDSLIAEQEQRIFEKESQNKFNDDII